MGSLAKNVSSASREVRSLDRELLRRRTRLAVGEAVRRAYSGTFTQTELAHALGVAQNTISRWTTGEVEPSLADIQAIEDVCGLQRGFVLRSAGLVAEPSTPEEMIEADHRLDRARRELLLAAYRAALTQSSG